MALLELAQELPAVDAPACTRSSRTRSGAWSSIAASASVAGAPPRARGSPPSSRLTRSSSRSRCVVVDDEHERARLACHPAANGRRTPRGRRAGSAGGRRACRRPARGPGRTTCGSSTGRRRGSARPGRASASPARPPAPRACRCLRSSSPFETYPKLLLPRGGLTAPAPASSPSPCSARSGRAAAGAASGPASASRPAGCRRAPRRAPTPTTNTARGRPAAPAGAEAAGGGVGAADGEAGGAPRSRRVVASRAAA